MIITILAAVLNVQCVAAAVVDDETTTFQMIHVRRLRASLPSLSTLGAPDFLLSFTRLSQVYLCSQYVWFRRTLFSSNLFLPFF